MEFLYLSGLMMFLMIINHFIFMAMITPDQRKLMDDNKMDELYQGLNKSQKFMYRKIQFYVIAALGSAGFQLFLEVYNAQ